MQRNVQVGSISYNIGHQTSNYAEYTALLHGLLVSFPQNFSVLSPG